MMGLFMNQDFCLISEYLYTLHKISVYCCVEESWWWQRKTDDDDFIEKEKLKCNHRKIPFTLSLVL